MLTLTLSGVAILVILMGIGGFFGWFRGIRAFLTVAVASTIAYLACANNGIMMISTLNRIYANSPRLVAFLGGNDPCKADLLGPLIPGEPESPLSFRIGLFLILIVVSLFVNPRFRWYRRMPDDKNESLSRVLGVFTGVYIVLLWIGGAVAFWKEFLASGNALGDQVRQLLEVLPDVNPALPSLMGLYFMMLLVVVVFNLNKVWRAIG